MKKFNFCSKIGLFVTITAIQVFVFLLGIFFSSIASASTGTATSNANWNAAASWTFAGVNRLPNCADTLVIPSSKTITVNNQNDYTACTSPMIIYVSGTLQFTNGNKLDLPCGSVIFILSGGTVKKSGPGGGSSTLISICGNVEWKAGDGPLTGVDTLGTVSPLPIDLISFEAKQNKKSVEINWMTATEINNSFFTIEKSTNGTEFFEIAKIKGAGNSTFNLAYSYFDNSPNSGIAYYRLKQTDYDGKHETFDPVAVKFLKSNSDGLDVSVLKNPFNEKLNLSLNSEMKGEVEIRLINLEGRQVYHSIDNHSESNLIETDGLSELKSGIYFLQVNSETESSGMIRVVKMN